MSLNTIVFKFALLLLVTLPSLSFAEARDEQAAKIQTVIESITVMVDLRRFDLLEQFYADTVTADYSSLWGTEPRELARDDIGNAWAGFIPGFDTTRHDISDIEVRINGLSASASAKVVASHWLDGESWIISGVYEFELRNILDRWVVSGWRFNLESESGDRSLVDVAEARAQNRDRKNAKDSDTWSAEEYSGLRGEKEIQTAMASKAFTWITGSPADNEKLSIGKNAQFFGFVALRYQSGRAANRGVLGRAMFSIASEDQRAVMADAVRNEIPALEEWWAVRETILSSLEDHLYTGTPIDNEKLLAIGEQFSLLNSTVAIHEARAYAAFEDLMSEDQLELVAQWRSDPAAASEYGQKTRVQDDSLDSADWKLLEDLYAKCFSWISGRRADNEIIPLGQPAQFFGFVSIRHKSGRGANRGKIAKDFYELLNSEQRAVLDAAVTDSTPLVRQFLGARHRYLNELEILRSAPDDFDNDAAEALARQMGRLETAIATVEAQAYRDIRMSMSDEQVLSAMNMRADYVVDESQIEVLDAAERGARLAILCSGCHGTPGAWRKEMVGPSLDGFWDRPIASAADFEYSEALRALSDQGDAQWTEETLDDFLASPRTFAPGTKMEFQGFMNPDDRRAIIQYLANY